jgi:large subunit ribosomal protein L9
VKVIFIEDVPNVARAGEAREVADGYGRNYLLPKKLAVLANSQASSVVEAQLKKVVQRRAQEEAEMVELAGRLDGVEITLKARAGAKERLYGSITSADIADELSSVTGLVVDKRKIELEEPIRQLGSYEVTVRFTHDIAAVIKISIVADKVVEEKEEKKKEGKKAEKKAEEKEVEGQVEQAEERKVEEKAEVKAEVKVEEKEVEEKAEVKAEVRVEEKAEGKVGKKTKKKAKKVEEKVEEKEERVEEDKEAEPGE